VGQAAASRADSASPTSALLSNTLLSALATKLGGASSPEASALLSAQMQRLGQGLSAAPAASPNAHQGDHTTSPANASPTPEGHSAAPSNTPIPASVLSTPARPTRGITSSDSDDENTTVLKPVQPKTGPISGLFNDSKDSHRSVDPVCSLDFGLARDDADVMSSESVGDSGIPSRSATSTPATELAQGSDKTAHSSPEIAPTTATLKRPSEDAIGSFTPKRFKSDGLNSNEPGSLVTAFMSAGGDKKRTPVRPAEVENQAATQSQVQQSLAVTQAQMLFAQAQAQAQAQVQAQLLQSPQQTVTTQKLDAASLQAVQTQQYLAHYQALLAQQQPPLSNQVQNLLQRFSQAYPTANPQPQPHGDADLVSRPISNAVQTRRAPAGDRASNRCCHYCGHCPRRAVLYLCSDERCRQAFCSQCMERHSSEPLPQGGEVIQTIDESREEDGAPVSVPTICPPGWLCTVCRGVCCCTVDKCTQNHRHCKRFRRRRVPDSRRGSTGSVTPPAQKS